MEFQETEMSRISRLDRSEVTERGNVPNMFRVTTDGTNQTR
jgi:hypothetical protein